MAPPKPFLELDIVVTTRAWHAEVWGLTALARTISTTAHDVAVGKGMPALNGPVAVAFSNDAAVKTLNARFRHKDKATNVLSFPAAGGQGGDVILALETVALEAETQGKSMRAHTAHLVAHGILHLMGYDHVERGPARRMESLERQVLERFGIADPYVSERSKRKP